MLSEACSKGLICNKVNSDSMWTMEGKEQAALQATSNTSNVSDPLNISLENQAEAGRSEQYSPIE